MSELLSRHRAVLPSWMPLYYESPLEITGGKGSRVTDADGRSYLDFFTGIATNILGYDVDEVREAVEAQVATGVAHTSTLYLIRHQVGLAEQIAELSGIPDAKVFFTNSGTEANETALLLATHARGSDEVLALRGSYHGRSFGTVAVTGNSVWKNSSLSPLNVHYLHGTDHAAPAFRHMTEREYIDACVADLRDVLDTTAPNVACMIAEPVQGVNGFAMPPDGLLGAYKEVMDEYGILMVSDEVQTGWGRTGTSFFGIGNHGVTPDAMTFAKGLGNGFAIGGVVARGDLMDALPAMGVATFGGNPVSTAAARATLKYVLDHDLQTNALRQGSTILDGLLVLRELPTVKDVRGKGLMFAVEMADPETGAPSPALAGQVLEAARERGLLVGKGGIKGNVLRMAPAMTLSDADAAEGRDLLLDAVRAVDAGTAS